MISQTNVFISPSLLAWSYSPSSFIPLPSATGGDGLDVLALKGKLESCRQDNAVLRRKLWLADDEHRSYLTLLQQAQKDQDESS